jgi:hypothetical protein
MILLAIAVVAFFLFAGKSPALVSGDGISGAGVTPLPTAQPVPIASATPQTPVIKNSTGGSLGAALGTASAPPNYYVSGNPGYNTQTKPSATILPTPRSGVPFKTFDQILPVPPAQPVGTRKGVVGIPQRSPVNPAGTYKPIIANRPVVVSRFGPEVASAPWTKLAVRSRQ